jgi:hypothetical protein
MRHTVHFVVLVRIGERENGRFPELTKERIGKEMLYDAKPEAGDLLCHDIPCFKEREHSLLYLLKFAN